MSHVLVESNKVLMPCARYFKDRLKDQEESIGKEIVLRMKPGLIRRARTRQEAEKSAQEDSDFLMGCGYQWVLGRPHYQFGSGGAPDMMVEVMGPE